MSDRDFLIEVNTQDILKLLMTDSGVSAMDAIRRFYVSAVFEKLQDCRTGLYLESPAYIYDLYLNEVKNCGIVQDEI